MKALLSILLVFLVGTLVCSAKIKPGENLLLICQGTENFSRENPRVEQVLLMREEVESLIKSGNLPIVIEYNKNVVWLYLNDINCAREYPTVDFKSDYFEMLDLFPLKLTKELKKKLKHGNKEFFKTLGIEYIIKDGEVISKIDYDKFDKYI